MPILFFILSLLILYFTKTWLTKLISGLIHQIGGDRNGVIWFWSIVFLPGTVIHEISHFLVAAATGARTGKIEIFPEFLDDEEESRGVALGSVQTQKLNPIQGFLVGMAPFFSGIILLFWLSQLTKENYLSSNYLSFFTSLYFFFVIANSFFPSWADIRQTIPMVIISLVTILALWSFGVGFSLEISKVSQNYLLALTQTLGISSALNLTICVILVGLRRVIHWIHGQN